jgi:hypothetical protein
VSGFNRLRIVTCPGLDIGGLEVSRVVNNINALVVVEVIVIVVVVLEYLK